MYLSAPRLSSIPTESPSVSTTGVVYPESFLRSFARFGLMSFIFGFYDNFIMIAAGEGIDQMLGPTLSKITTSSETQMFAAAGLGNTLSDAFGVAVADRVVGGLGKIGGPVFGILRPKGMANDDGAFWGKFIGITAGCLVGMGTALTSKWVGYVGSAVAIPAVLLYAETLPDIPNQESQA